MNSNITPDEMFLILKYGSLENAAERYLMMLIEGEKSKVNKLFNEEQLTLIREFIELKWNSN